MSRILKSLENWNESNRTGNFERCIVTNWLVVRHIGTSIKNTIMQTENRTLLAATHLSQLLDFVTGIGGLIVPLVLWLTQRDKVVDMDENGKAIINFRISMFLYVLLCVPLILVFGLGLLGFLVLGVLYFIFPIVNAIKASKGEAPHYPMSIKFV